MQMKCQDTDDYKELRQVIKYLQAAPELGLMLEEDDKYIIKWWMGASLPSTIATQRAQGKPPVLVRMT